jgi:hypothetical protein
VSGVGLPSRPSAAEIVAGSGANKRLWTPADIKAMIDAHGGGGGGGSGTAYTDLFAATNEFGLPIKQFFGKGPDASGLILTTIFDLLVDPSGITEESAVTITDPDGIITSATLIDSVFDIAPSSPVRNIPVRALELILNGSEVSGNAAEFDWTWNGIPVHADYDQLF